MEPERRLSPAEIRLHFSTCYYLLSPHSSSLSQGLKLASSRRSQTSCCIPTDISWGNMTLYSPQNTAWAAGTLRSIELDEALALWRLSPGHAVVVHLANPKFPHNPMHSSKRKARIIGIHGRVQIIFSYLDSISSDELLDGREQAPPSTGGRVLLHFWVPPLGTGWAAGQSGVWLLRRFTHSQPHCFSSHMKSCFRAKWEKWGKVLL